MPFFDNVLQVFRGATSKARSSSNAQTKPLVDGELLGLIAGNGRFPFHFIDAAHRRGLKVIAVCHAGETDPTIEEVADQVTWVKVGELGAMIRAFHEAGVTRAAMAGGISRVKLFGGVKLDARGALLLAKLRSTKDDVIMRGIADELGREGVEIVPSHLYLDEYLVERGVLTKSRPTVEEVQDLQVGVAALQAMSAQDIGQLVVVREGVITAVEAVEGSDAAILRGGELARGGAVVVKFAKTTQDLRFDMPAVGERTLDSMIQAKCRVLALEAGKSLLFDREKFLARANAQGIAVVGCDHSGLFE